jgi:DNA topoisomerase-1
MMKRWGRNGWFLGCSGFPACKGTRSLPLGVKCPKCGGEIIEVRARGRKRPFYGCSNYNKEPKCDYRIWQRPVPEPCQKCGAEFMVRAGTPEKPALRCVAEGCNYQRPVETGDPVKGAPGDDAGLPPTGTENGNKS